MLDQRESLPTGLLDKSREEIADDPAWFIASDYFLFRDNINSIAQ